MVFTLCPSTEGAGGLLLACKSSALNYLEETTQSWLLFAVMIAHLVPGKTTRRRAVKLWPFFSREIK